MGVGARSGLLGDHRRDLCGPIAIGGGRALGALFGTECTGDDIELEGATLRFVSIDDGRSGLCEVTIAGGRATTATIAGVRFTVDAAP